MVVAWGSLQEGVLVVSHDGIILACDDQARYLCQRVSLPNLCGQSFEKVFDVDLIRF